MLRLKTGVVLTMFAAAMVVAGSITYIVTEMAVSVRCRAPSITNIGPSGSSALPTGITVQPDHGKQF